MLIERFLNASHLKRYRAWKRNRRAQVKIWFETIKRAFSSGGLERLTDNNYFPIFICGVSGSGTTLLGGLLDQDYESDIFIHVSDRLHETDRAMWMEHSTYYDDLGEYYDELIRVRGYSTNKVRRAVLGLYRRLTLIQENRSLLLTRLPILTWLGLVSYGMPSRLPKQF